MPRKALTIITLSLIAIVACTVSFVETPPPASNQIPTQPQGITSPSENAPTDQSAPRTPIPLTLPGATLPAGVSGITGGIPSGPYGVILVEPNDVLNMRAGPGVYYGVLGTFKPTFNGITLTGATSQAGDDLWVEAQNPQGVIGWVNSRFLTEYLTPAAFCADGEVANLISKLPDIVDRSDGESLSGIISPMHGLDLRFWRYGTVANYDQSEARVVFESAYQVNWGPAPGSGQDTKGTFSEIPLPKLREVLNGDFESHCNESLDLATFSQQPWPQVYTNINFYTLYKPGSPGVELDWRAWLAGIEYVQGKPYLFALIHFQWEP